MVKIIVAPVKYDSEDVIGRFIDETYFDTLVEEDTDCYIPPACGIDLQVGCDVPVDCTGCAKGTDESRIAFKFRKNYFTKHEQKEAYEGLRAAARETENRGLASGILEGHTTEEGRIARAFVTNYQPICLRRLMQRVSRPLKTTNQLIKSEQNTQLKNLVKPLLVMGSIPFGCMLALILASTLKFGWTVLGIKVKQNVMLQLRK